MPFSTPCHLFILVKKQKLDKIIRCSQTFKKILHQEIPTNKIQSESIIQPPLLSIELQNFDYTKKKEQDDKFRLQHNFLSLQPLNENNQITQKEVPNEEIIFLKQSNINFGINYMQIQKCQSDNQQCNQRRMEMQTDNQKNQNINENRKAEEDIKISISAPIQELAFKNKPQTKCKKKQTQIIDSKSQIQKNYEKINTQQRLFYNEEKNSKFKIDHFKQFLEFVMDFKLMKVESYHPVLHKIQIAKTLRRESQLQIKKKIRQSLRGGNGNILVSSMNAGSTKNRKNVRTTNSTKLFQSLQLSTKLDHSIDRDISQEQSQSNKRRQLQNSVISLKVSNLENEQQNKLQVSNNSKQSRESSLFCYKLPKKETQSKNEGQLIKISNDKNLFSSQNLSDRLSLQKNTTKLISFEDLKLKLANARAQTIHQGFYCNQCFVQPIVGNRYVCIECQDYDLCQRCYKIQCRTYQRYSKNISQHQFYLNKDNEQSKNAFKILRKSKQKIKQNLLLKKNFSQIEEQEEEYDQSSLSSDIQDVSQKLSSEHVHIMQIVLSSTLQNQLIRLSRVLRQTNNANRIRTSHILKSIKNMSIEEIQQKNIKQMKNVGNIIESHRLHKNSYKEELSGIYQKLQKIKQLKRLSQTCKEILKSNQNFKFC